MSEQKITINISQIIDYSKTPKGSKAVNNSHQYDKGANNLDGMPFKPMELSFLCQEFFFENMDKYGIEMFSTITIESFDKNSGEFIFISA